MEEAGAALGALFLLAVFDLTFIRQIYMMWRAPIREGRFSPGAESLETALFDEAEIPWDDLAFPVIRRTLELYFADRRRGRFDLHTERIDPDRRIGLATDRKNGGKEID
jgi:hypothetical protein